ncbi:MAG: hypothetical protein KDB72_18215 [Mycobacterium sp.]|nr:hypothetical protein [Mycobacterium sp.]
MRTGTKTSKFLLACLGTWMLAPLALTAAPAATAAPCPGGQILDPTTGICWSQNNPSNSYGGSGNIPCLPGRLGLCLGALQNTPIPGAALQPQAPAGANRVWP